MLLPLLACKVHEVRWSARTVSALLFLWHMPRCLCGPAFPTFVCLQILMNMAMVPDIARRLEEEGVPNHIHGMNLVRVRIAHDPNVPPAASLVALGSHITAQLMRVSDEAPGDPKAGKKK